MQHCVLQDWKILSTLILLKASLMLIILTIYSERFAGVAKV